MSRRAAITTSTIAAVALVALGLCSPASTHGGGAARGYSSTITSVTPASPALRVAILEGDDRIRLRVLGRHVVEIDGYEGEPYLRFEPHGVERNKRSPATYLNDDRFGRIRLPAIAKAKAAPVWEQVAAAGRAYDWHDHRIHWMSTSYPPKVKAAKDRPHHIFDWAVKGTFDGRPLIIRGSLDYRPPKGQSSWRLVALGAVILVLLAATLVLVRWLRRRSSPAA